MTNIAAKSVVLAVPLVAVVVAFGIGKTEKETVFHAMSNSHQTVFLVPQTSLVTQTTVMKPFLKSK